MLLEKIQKENDIKQLKPEELEKLAEESVSFLWRKSVSQAGIWHRISVWWSLRWRCIWRLNCRRIR